MPELTKKQLEFCNRYVKYPEKTFVELASDLFKHPTTQCSRILKKPHCAEYIQKLNDKIDKSNIMNIKELQEMLTKIAKGDEQEKIAKYNPDTKEYAIVEVPSSLKIRLKATDLLGKSLGAYIDRIESNVNTNITISVEDDYE